MCIFLESFEFSVQMSNIYFNFWQIHDTERLAHKTLTLLPYDDAMFAK
jgi:hypothetical protein